MILAHLTFLENGISTLVNLHKLLVYYLMYSMAKYKNNSHKVRKAVVLLVMLGAVLQHSEGQEARLSCDTPQYLEFGRPGTISCSINGAPYGIYWYDTTDTRHTGPVLSYEAPFDDGPTHKEEGFHIYENGSLLIRNVSLVHERNFKIVTLYNAEHEDAVISVIVTVTPKQRFPYISLCGKAKICFVENKKFRKTLNLTCSIFESRPAAELTWVVMEFNITHSIPSTATISQGNMWINSHATVSLPLSLQQPLTLLICQVEIPFPLSNQESSHLLIETTDFADIDSKVEKLVFKTGASPTLTCEETDALFVVWKTMNSFGSDTVMIKSPGTSTYVLNPYSTSENGSLTFPWIAIKHEGMYTCVFGNGVRGGYNSYEVFVLVPPDPRDLVINQCDPPDNNDCLINTSREGKLTCTVRGIYPEVHLEWKAIENSSSPSVSVEVSQTKVIYNGETFEISSELSYHLTLPLVQTSLECKVGGQYASNFALSRKVTLIPTTAVAKMNSVPSKARLLAPLLTVFAFVTVVAAFLVRVVCFPSNRKKAKIFQDILKERYLNLCNNIQVTPMDARAFSLEKVFVENGLEMKMLHTEEWTQLESHHEVFVERPSKRIFLIGDAGTGKTIFTFQAAFDWCTANENSPLKSVELLILLQLRLVKNGQTIYQAIRQQLCVTDSQINEKDIKNILKTCSSCVIIFDGYDEYVNRENDDSAEVNSIISGTMFPNFRTVISSRPICVQQKSEKNITKIRLTGFNEKARLEYVSKVMGDKALTTDYFRDDTQTNPVLQCLGHVPFFLGLLTHIKNYPDNLKEINSLTEYFHILVCCMVTHEENKGKNISENKQDNNEKDKRGSPLTVDNSKLDKIAFNRIVTSGQVLWDKEELCQEIGQEVCEQYLRIGILLEEEVMEVPSPFLGHTKGLERKRKVRFYHQIFAEWCAARHVAQNFEHESANPIFEETSDLLYLRRFACVLQPLVAQKIIKTTKSKDEKIMTLLEQMDKTNMFEETIKELCEETFTLSRNDTIQSQLLTLQFLCKVCDREIPITEVILEKCYCSYQEETGAITLSTGQNFFPLQSLKSLKIILERERFQEDDQLSFLRYSIKCYSLKNLCIKFDRQPFRVNDVNILHELRERGAKVEWRTFRGDNFYLDLQKGSWQFDESKPLLRRVRNRRVPGDIPQPGEEVSLLTEEMSP